MVRIEAKTSASPHEIQEAFNGLNATLIHADGVGTAGKFFGVLMFEKKYWRAQSYSSLSVLVRKEGDKGYTQVTFVSSTERQDNILISLFASSENAFAREALQALERSVKVYDVTEDDRHNVFSFDPDF